MISFLWILHRVPKFISCHVASTVITRWEHWAPISHNYAHCSSKTWALSEYRDSLSPNQPPVSGGLQLIHNFTLLSLWSNSKPLTTKKLMDNGAGCLLTYSAKQNWSMTSWKNWIKTYRIANALSYWFCPFIGNPFRHTNSTDTPWLQIKVK